MPIIKKGLTITSHGKNMEVRELSYIDSGRVKWYTTLEKSLGLSQNVKCIVIIWFSNSTSRSLCRELKTYVHTKTCARMFMAALPVTAKAWKQYECLSADELDK